MGFLLATGAVAINLPDEFGKTLFIGLSLGSFITGGLASKDLHMIKGGHLLETWMSKRALAETARIDYLDTVVKQNRQPLEHAEKPILCPEKNATESRSTIFREGQAKRHCVLAEEATNVIYE